VFADYWMPAFAGMTTERGATAERGRTAVRQGSAETAMTPASG
jgi:hypothetical protein